MQLQDEEERAFGGMESFGLVDPKSNPRRQSPQPNQYMPAPFDAFSTWEEDFRSEKDEVRARVLAEHLRGRRLALTCADYSIYNVEDVSPVHRGLHLLKGLSTSY